MRILLQTDYSLFSNLLFRIDFGKRVVFIFGVFGIFLGAAGVQVFF